MTRALRIGVLGFAGMLAAAGCGDGDDDGAATTGDARSFLHESSWPVPTSDTWRSSSVARGGLPADVRSEDLIASSAALGAVPIFSLTYSNDTLFVLGGNPFLLELFTLAQANTPPTRDPSVLLELVENFVANSAVDPYVAKVDATTMAVEILELPKGDTPNYPGGLVAHRNGFLYAAATATLHEIDPDDFRIVRSLALPLDGERPGSTIYNSLQISTRNGDLFLKTGTQAPTGMIVSVDVDRFEVRDTIVAELGTARLTTAMQDGVEFIYIPGETETLRFEVTDDGFELDADWSKTYLVDGDGTTPGVGVLNMGNANAVLFPNNNTVLYGVSAPLGLFSQSTIDDTALPRSVNATGTSAPGGSFTMVTGNPVESGTVVAQDSVNGRLAAWRVGQGGSFERLWETSDFSAAVGSAMVVETDRLYIDDRVCPDETQTGCTLFLVVLDLSNGEELARVEVAGSTATLSHIMVSDDAVYHIASEGGLPRGFITKVSAR